MAISSAERARETGPKMKGIVSQSVKDVLQSLVDDGLMQNRMQVVRENQRTQSAQLDDLKEQLEVEAASRQESTERTSSLSRLSEAKSELVELEKELLQYGACDPLVLEDKKRALILAKEAVARWTDNYIILMSHFTRQYCVDPEDIRKHLGVEESYEDI
ncbi:hypothetical protein NLI96_g10325 [Meripilus lineatus]|uniref:Leucine zipper with capping helix domain-containing protein n=1 Tax=Meripilus lineatus TaxID=2056292 RepID=A0AAD5UTU0_9APHY|nr:hypothetical protein NLI96_g10325 [Physisporinus lineatus]